EQAWEAVHAGNLDLAEKLIRRAVAAQPDNPVLWNDQGVVLGLRQKEAEAGESFRTALSLGPTFAEPYARLAAPRFRQGFAKEAVALQLQAVKHAAQNPAYAEQLAAYQSLAGPGQSQAEMPLTAEERTAAAPAQPDGLAAESPGGDWRERVAELD